MVGELFKTGPSLSPRKKKTDNTDDKLKVLQDEVAFMRQHSKSLQTELTEALATLAFKYDLLTKQDYTRKDRRVR